MMRGARKQRGVTLLISLIMLLVLTLFAVAMIRLSNTNVVVVGNMQSQRALEAVAQQAIETDLNSANFYNDQINGTGPWAGGATTSNSTINGYTVTLNKPQCLYTQKSAGYSAISNVAPDDDFFEVEATATDPVTGATTDVVQGVKVTLPTGNCVWP
ncbi:MAG: hypothetical protein ACM3ZT_12255 [Bacillota bacterium]